MPTAVPSPPGARRNNVILAVVGAIALVVVISAAVLMREDSGNTNATNVIDPSTTTTAAPGEASPTDVPSAADVPTAAGGPNPAPASTTTLPATVPAPTAPVSTLAALPDQVTPENEDAVKATLRAQLLEQIVDNGATPAQGTCIVDKLLPAFSTQELLEIARGGQLTDAGQLQKLVEIQSSCPA